MVLSEAVAVGIIGTALGTVAALGFSLGLREVLSIVIGFHPPLRLDPFAPVLWGLAATTVVAIAAAWPAWRTSRIEVLDGLRYE
jgi:putative ABC transport system permease protein